MNLLTYTVEKREIIRQIAKKWATSGLECGI